MDIQLKKIHYYPQQSIATDAFTADLFVDGKRVAKAFNSGEGEKTNVFASTPADRKVVRQAEAFCRDMPPRKMPPDEYDPKETKIPMTLDRYLDKIVDDHVRKLGFLALHGAHQARMDMAIIVAKPAEDMSRFYTFSAPVNRVIDKNPALFQQVIDEHMKPRLAEGYVVINNNIPPGKLEAFGILPGQVRPLPILEQKKKQARQLKPAKTNRQRRQL